MSGEEGIEGIEEVFIGGSKDSDYFVDMVEGGKEGVGIDCSKAPSYSVHYATQKLKGILLRD